MFKVREGSIATDRDGVRENIFHNIFADYFFSAERTGRECKIYFGMNDPAKINVMNLFFSKKGE